MSLLYDHYYYYQSWTCEESSVFEQLVRPVVDDAGNEGFNVAELAVDAKYFTKLNISQGRTHLVRWPEC